MKPAALRHLLLAAARSARQVAPADAARIDAIAGTLTVDRPSRGRYCVSWTEPRNGPATLEVSAERFDFYRRGDVAAIVGRRPAELDARGANWLEAHRLWGELLGASALADLAVAPSRAGHALPHQDKTDRYGVWPQASAAIVAAAAALAGPPGLFVAATGGLAAAAVASAGRARAVSVALAPVAAMTAAALLDVSGPALRQAAAGLALLSGASLLAPTKRRVGRHAGAFAGACAIGLSIPVAPVPWLAVGAVTVAADAAALAVRGERGRLGGLVAASGAALVVGLLLSAAVDAVGGGGRSASTVTAAVLIAGIVLLLAGVWRATCGVHDRLSSWFVVPAAALAIVMGARGPAAAVAAAGLIAALAGAAFRRPRRPRAEPLEDAAVAVSALEVPVTIGGPDRRR
ncbi:MAG: hypothetical protein AB7G23_20470 [Vicinamibacterales bacterium]